jgi:hypothetical protein
MLTWKWVILRKVVRNATMKLLLVLFVTRDVTVVAVSLYQGMANVLTNWVKERQNSRCRPAKLALSITSESSEFIRPSNPFTSSTTPHAYQFNRLFQLKV